MRKFLRTLLALLALGVLLFSGWKLYDYLRQSSESAELYDELAAAAVVVRAEEPESSETASADGEIVPEPPVVTAWPGETEEEVPIEVDFDTLLAACDDIVAWLYSPDTVINYPIVQAGDNSYYLHRLIDGSTNSGGTLFMECENAPDFSDRNSIVYGHNMKNNSMFGTLPDYSDQDYYEAHPVLWLLTPSANYKVELIAGCVTDSEAEIYSIVSTDEQLQALVDEAVSRSTFTSGVELAEGDRILTLSTCSYEYSNARYVLLGRLVEVS